MLYHYTNDEGLKGILASKRLWLVSSLEMSDVSDRFYGNLFATSFLLCSDDEDAVFLRNRIKHEDLLAINANSLDLYFYTISFCKRWDNEALWKKYADKGYGVCIEIDEGRLMDFVNQVILENDMLCKDEDLPADRIIELRTVEYGWPKQLFMEALHFSKRCVNFQETCERDDYLTEQLVNIWAELLILCLAGVVKAKAYEAEEEVRLIFKDKFAVEYVEKDNTMFSLFKREELMNSLKKLGLDQVVSGRGKRRMELNLNGVFDSSLIRTVYIGNPTNERVQDIREMLRVSGLENCLLKNRDGQLL